MRRLPQRIVCLTTETVEVIYAIGEQERIAGISGYTVRPPQARKEKPKVYAFTTGDIDKILAVRPDLVLTFCDLQADIARDLFKAGVATSGSYNKTLTPFGFQNERRSVWQARDVYIKASPFFYADKIKHPLLLVHGEDDANPGTEPIQSLKLYQAIRGNGGTTKLVMLPHEPHWYTALESNEQVVHDMLDWFDTYVKNAPGTK